MKKITLLFSHLTVFLAGMITVAVYHHWWVNPTQVEWIKSIARSGADIGYPGDWVLDILFPAIPALALCLLGTIIFGIVSRFSKITQRNLLKNK